jgi:hypothetical protein
MERLTRGLSLLIILVAIAVPVLAQDGTTTPEAPATPEPIAVRVRVEDAWVRAAPSLDAPMIGSVFLDDPLEIVGRNFNGLWYEVRRPYRETSLGWVFNEMVSDVDVQIEYLSMTDNTTDVEGAIKPTDTGVAVFTLAEIVMRASPSLQGQALGQLVPQSAVAQVIYRNQDGTWLYINYGGFEGWIAAFLVRERPELATLPLAPGLPPLPAAQGVIVPPEIQLEQVERLRAYVIASRDLAAQLKVFWSEVAKGDVMPCEPPPFVNEYPYTAADVQELPELGRLVPRIDEATESLNAAITPLTQCGVLDRTTVRHARSSAINAEIIFANNVNNLNLVEEIIESQVDK